MILCFQLPPPLRSRGQNERGGKEERANEQTAAADRMPTEEGREGLTDS